MYIGPFQLNAQVDFVVESRSSSWAGVPADLHPTFKVYDGGLNSMIGGNATAGTTTPYFSYVGAYRGVFFASAAQNFQRGQNYTIVASWQVSGSPRTQIFTFNVT